MGNLRLILVSCFSNPRIIKVSILLNLGMRLLGGLVQRHGPVLFVRQQSGSVKLYRIKINLVCVGDSFPRDWSEAAECTSTSFCIKYKACFSTLVSLT